MRLRYRRKFEQMNLRINCFHPPVRAHLCVTTFHNDGARCWSLRLRNLVWILLAPGHGARRTATQVRIPVFNAKKLLGKLRVVFVLSCVFREAVPFSLESVSVASLLWEL